MAKKFNAALVLSDSPIFKNSFDHTERRLWPLHDIETANFCYMPFHGSKKLYASSYTDHELSHYAQVIKEKIKRGQNVYAYFNNDLEGHAIENAQRLLKFF